MPAVNPFVVIRDHMPSWAKYSMDASALGITASTFANILPQIASALSIIWFLIRIYESRTFQRLIGRKDAPPTPPDV
jgi:hypothetical protein